MAYIADFEEQTRLAGIGSKSCPHCQATAKNLGNAEDQPPRTSASILQAIEDVKQILAEKYPGDCYDAMDCLKECKPYGLNGVDKPFWRLIPDGDICEILSPDLLHGFHKFFYDHVFEWNTLSLGENEMDARMRSQLRLTGDRLFRNGVSHLSQTTMKEHRDLQRVHMAVVAGAPIPNTRRVTTATRSILNCIYLAQLTSHSDRSLKAYRQSHEQFHSQKQIWLDNKSRLGKDAMRKEAMRNDGAEIEESAKENARNHFNIPKLHILRHLADHVELKGTADNYTTEAMEHLHIDLVKNAYRASNRRNWKEQTTRWLTRREKLKDFAAWMDWNNTDESSLEDPCVLEEDWADEAGDNEPDDETNSPLDEDTTNDLDLAVYADEDGNIPITEDSSQWPGLESLWVEAEDIEDHASDSYKFDSTHDQESELEVNGKDLHRDQQQQREDSPGPSNYSEPAKLGKRKRGSQNATRTPTDRESRTRLRKPVSPPTGLSCFQSIRLRPLVTRMPVQQALDRYGTPDLLTELQRHPYAASLINSPDEHTLIDIWPYIRVQPPPRLHAPVVGLQRVCVQRSKPNDTPNVSASGVQPSDSVIYLNYSGVPSSTTRIHDCSAGQLALLFRLSPSAFNPNPPLLAYIRRFTKIPHHPDAETGMYLVKKDRRTNGELFGRVIEARQIVRVCPLAPVIRGAANRKITPETSFSFYESFYINKYHSHEVFDYLHVT
ncbi:unnamed protein product [Rhizoctonia solani]|uniref:Uncharacterized protein n=1 Tax=Rhizoctonia solani TaxID=456999 RepID=A0A8H2W754_9AGAM|nr:unnamed protein product [Rhizoctonia solani]